jgi:hypothetical protein
MSSSTVLLLTLKHVKVVEVVKAVKVIKMVQVVEAVKLPHGAERFQSKVDSTF